MTVCEFSVVPLGKGESVSWYVAECLKIVQQSGLTYQMTAMGTIVEGELDAVMEVVTRCHRAVRGLSPRVLTTLRLDDREGPGGRLNSKVRSVQTKVSPPG
ncbi:MAG: MTH1187 family thiamine-binding protein [Candidatus Bipolaricaulota bacterium]